LLGRFSQRWAFGSEHLLPRDSGSGSEYCEDDRRAAVDLPPSPAFERADPAAHGRDPGADLDSIARLRVPRRKLSARKLVVTKMPFNPPKASVFKQFVILDAEGVVAALSAIDGGQIDEILTRSSEDEGKDLGGEINVRVAKGGGTRARTRKVEEEIRRARTRHATAAKLLETLKEKESVGVVDGPFDMEVAEQVAAGMVLEFRAELRLHPVHQPDAMLRSFIKVAPKFGEKQVPNEMRPIMAMWGALIGTDQSNITF